MERKFKKGNVVKLKSGSEPMTVLGYKENHAGSLKNAIYGRKQFEENTETDFVMCKWMYKGKLESKNFDEEMLMLITTA